MVFASLFSRSKQLFALLVFVVMVLTLGILYLSSLSGMSEEGEGYFYVRESNSTVFVYSDVTRSPIGLFQLPASGRVGDIKIYGKQLYYSDMSNKAVMMLDIESGVINTHIRLETRPDRFWISERQQLLYILNELRSQISVYSLDHPGLLSQIPLGEFRGEMVFDAKSDRLYVALHDQTVQVIDLALFRSLGYVSVKQDIDVMHLNIADEQLWVQEANNHVVSVVDLKNHEIIKQMGPSNENDR